MFIENLILKHCKFMFYTNSCIDPLLYPRVFHTPTITVCGPYQERLSFFGTNVIRCWDAHILFCAEKASQVYSESNVNHHICYGLLNVL